MQLFIDTAEIEEIKSLNITGLIDGVTTNPSLIAKSGRNIISTIEEICNESVLVQESVVEDLEIKKKIFVPNKLINILT